MTTDRAVRSSRTLLFAALAVAAVTVAGWVIGLEWAPALLVAVALVAALGLRRMPTTNDDEAWPALPDVGSDHGVRREVTRLSWSLHGNDSRVEWPSVRRLRAVADRRLARYDLRLGDPADADRCRELLGPSACRVLTASRSDRVTFDDFAGALTAVERLTAVESLTGVERLAEEVRRV